MIKKFHNLNEIGEISPIPEDCQDKLKILISNEEEIHIEGFDKIKSIDEIEEHKIKDYIFLLFFHSDDEYLYHIDKIVKNEGKFLIHMFWHKSNYVHSSRNARLAMMDTLRRIDDISHYVETIHGNICQAIEQTKNVEGDYVEIGVFKGGSALTAFNYMKYSGILRKSYLFDTFDGFNYEESNKSSDTFWNNTHKLWGEDETMDRINSLLKTECPMVDFELIKSNICKDNLPDKINKIAVANIDVDILEATEAAFYKVAERVVKGGIIIAEDPTSTPGLIGALYAMEQFLKSDIGKNFMKIHVTGQYFLIKMN